MMILKRSLRAVVVCRSCYYIIIHHSVISYYGIILVKLFALRRQKDIIIWIDFTTYLCNQVEGKLLFVKCIENICFKSS